MRRPWASSRHLAAQGGEGGGGVRLKPGLFGSWHLGFLLPN